MCLSLKNKDEIFAFRMIQQSNCLKFSLADPKSVFSTYVMAASTLTPGGEPGEIQAEGKNTNS